MQTDKKKVAKTRGRKEPRWLMAIDEETVIVKAEKSSLSLSFPFEKFAALCPHRLLLILHTIFLMSTPFLIANFVTFFSRTLFPRVL